MEFLQDLLGRVSGFVCGPYFLIPLLVGTGIFITVRLKFIQLLGLKHAFTGASAAGGVAGYTVAQAMRFGIARGVFSNESGLGSAPIAHAAARTEEPVREGLVAMIGPLVDTLIICTMTALVILVSGAWQSGLDGATLTSQAFSTGLPGSGMFAPGRMIVSFGLVFFAFSTLISWSYYGDRATEFIFGAGSVMIYRVVYVVLIPVGAAGRVEDRLDVLGHHQRTDGTTQSGRHRAAFRRRGQVDQGLLPPRP
ncbi:MAG: alanine:cation symporter family protein [Candidatus Lernaella stagnicola]|nr:alanine:cation symporter family protein [Candidatus Lernaella stagnicola]